MKKIFTLAAIAMIALGANAQTESWNAVSADGTLDAAFGSADAWNADFTVSPTTNVTLRFVAGQAPLETTTPNLNSSNWDVLGAPEYRVENLHIDKKDADGNEIGSDFKAVHGQGVPAASFIGEAEMKDGEPKTDDKGNPLYYVPQRESDGTSGGYIYYEPDGSKGVPSVGFFFDVTPKVSGQMKVAFWANKGGGRSLYIVKMSTGKALNPFGDAPEYHAEGYVQNYRDADGSLHYWDNLPIDSTYQIATFNGETGDSTLNEETGKMEPVVFNAQNQRKAGYLFFNVDANETYRILGRNWQVGFQGYEFTPGGTSGIATISQDKKFDVNAPVYNLAGQRVTKSYRGVVIQNGKKFYQKGA